MLSKYQQRLDKVINKLCEVRNELTRNYDVEFELETQLCSVEEAAEGLAQATDEETKDL
jgi:hypothetical protein